MIDSKKIKEMLAQLEWPRHIEPPRQPGPLGDAEFDAFEDRIGIRVPDDLREWLKISNGAFVGTVPVFGVHPPSYPLSMEKLFEIYPSWREKKWIPVASDGCGNYYVIPTQGEYGEGFPIVFVEAVTDYETPKYIVASDLSHFLIFLIEDEQLLMKMEPLDLLEGEPTPWPFDEQKVVNDDPAILNFRDVRVPWSSS
jgi:cell wall assembly regulator SMI1